MHFKISYAKWWPLCPSFNVVTHKGSENLAACCRRHFDRTFIQLNLDILFIKLLGTILSEIWIEIQHFSIKTLKMSSAKWWPFWLGINVLSSSVTFLSIIFCHKSEEFFRDTYYTGVINTGNVQNTMVLSIIHYSDGRDVNQDSSHLKPYVSI